MILKINDKSSTARIVVDIVKKYFEDMEVDEDSISALSVVGYNNGREQGLGITVYFKDNRTNKVFWIADQRNSDEIVIWEDETDGSEITENAKPKYFKHRQYGEAAFWLASKLTKLN